MSLGQLVEPPAPWERVTKFDPRAAAFADRHYNRRKIGSPQFMPPGQTIVLLTPDAKALFGWWRPKPGIEAMNHLDGWTCTIFRNESSMLSSMLILAAENMLKANAESCGLDGMLTYVWTCRIRSVNPGCCFQKAGWRKTGWSADQRKRLLQKPFEMAGRS